MLGLAPLGEAGLELEIDACMGIEGCISIDKVCFACCRLVMCGCDLFLQVRESIGTVLISLSYSPKIQKLGVIVLRAKDLNRGVSKEMGERGLGSSWQPSHANLVCLYLCLKYTDTQYTY